MKNSKLYAENKTQHHSLDAERNKQPKQPQDKQHTARHDKQNKTGKVSPGTQKKSS